jgi:predicted TIM-barrel fold metal-dependent hydrolase
MTLCDAHCHFFSQRFFAALGREKYGPQSDISSEHVARELGWEPPGPPDTLADRWLAELDEHHVARVALIASVPGDEESVAAAVRRHPRRFVGFFVLNPIAPDALERARHAFADLGLRCVCLFPALHRYRLDDERIVELFKVAAAHRGAVFAHCGYLSIEARVRLQLVSQLDLRCGDPLTLASTAIRFPQVPVIVPHFGSGFFREALMAADAAPNIYLDTSSSNAWVKYVPGLTLTEVFRRALATAGPNRLIFGTDSSFFPRGWRRVVHGAQRTALDEIGVEPEAATKIFGGNFERVFAQA